MRWSPAWARCIAAWACWRDIATSSRILADSWRSAVRSARAAASSCRGGGRGGADGRRAPRAAPPLPSSAAVRASAEIVTARVTSLGERVEARRHAVDVLAQLGGLGVERLAQLAADLGGGAGLRPRAAAADPGRPRPSSSAAPRTPHRSRQSARAWPEAACVGSRQPRAARRRARDSTPRGDARCSAHGPRTDSSVAPTCSRTACTDSSRGADLLAHRAHRLIRGARPARGQPRAPSHPWRRPARAWPPRPASGLADTRSAARRAWPRRPP